MLRPYLFFRLVYVGLIIMVAVGRAGLDAVVCLGVLACLEMTLRAIAWQSKGAVSLQCGRQLTEQLELHRREHAKELSSFQERLAALENRLPRR